MYEETRAAVLEVMQALHHQGLIYHKSGNISARTPEGHVAIKPSGVSYTAMTPEDIVIVDVAGRVIDGRLRPSSETPMHTGIYRACPEVNAVVHTHSKHALALATVGISIPIFCNEGLSIGGPIPVTEYACAGSQAIGRAALQALQGPPPVKGVLLRNHGALAIGNTLGEASFIAQIIEILAEVFHLALQVGQPVALTEAQIAEIRATYASKK